MKEEKARLEEERDTMLEKAKAMEDEIAQKQQKQKSTPKTEEQKRVWGGGSVTSENTESQQSITPEKEKQEAASSVTTPPPSSSSSSEQDLSFFSNRPPTAATGSKDATDDIDKQDYIHSDGDDDDFNRIEIAGIDQCARYTGKGGTMTDKRF